MAWKEISVEELAETLGISVREASEKQRLMNLIVKKRKALKISQAVLAQKLGVTQGRIAQIESGIGTSRVTFDVLLNILSVLGVDFHIATRKAA